MHWLCFPEMRAIKEKQKLSLFASNDGNSKLSKTEQFPAKKNWPISPTDI
jgi:hypothetical protein